MSIELEPPIAGPDGKPRQRKVRPARAKAQPEEKATAGNGTAPGDVGEGDGAAADGDFSESAPEPDAAKPPRPSVGKQETSGSCKMTTKGLVWRDPDNDEKPPIVVAGQFEIIAESRDDFGFNWGILAFLRNLSQSASRDDLLVSGSRILLPAEALFQGSRILLPAEALFQDCDRSGCLRLLNVVEPAAHQLQGFLNLWPRSCAGVTSHASAPRCSIILPRRIVRLSRVGARSANAFKPSIGEISSPSSLSCRILLRRGGYG